MSKTKKSAGLVPATNPEKRVEQITQSDLENIITIEAQIRRYTRMLHRVKGEALRKLASANCEVEEGHRSYEFIESFNEGVHTKELWVS